MLICVPVCLYLFLCECILYVCVRVCVYIGLRNLLILNAFHSNRLHNTCLYACLSADVFVCISVCISVCMYLRISVFISACIYVFSPDVILLWLTELKAATK